MAGKVRGVGSKGDKGDEGKAGSLAVEIVELRAALQEAKRRMQSGEEDMAKMGLLIARLSDSLGRALLAQERLAGSGDRSAWLRSEMDRLLREMGLGE